MTSGPKWWGDKLIDSPVQWGLCLDEKSFRKALKQIKLPKEHHPEFTVRDSGATVHHITSPEGNYLSLVCLKESDRPLHVRCALLVHESVHIWQRIREIMGETNPSSEFEAYSVQRIAQDLMQGLMENEMPLIKSKSDKARSKNIAKEIASGKPVKQAVAIGYSVQREAMKKKPKSK